MRLLNTRTLRLVDKPSGVRFYATLSHRWTDDEVTFDDIADVRKARRQAGWTKIFDFCKKAHAHGYDYAWVDTCCIDKKSSSELSEAINSMFNWYRGADVCYAYLADYEHGAVPEEQLPKCEWFTRGWTLQELLAPDNVRFYDKMWAYIGDKESFAPLISRITSIPEPVLSGKEALSTYSVAQRMSWAASRVTTRIEDTAYCLLGLFDINMPLLYGERHKAFFRLQKEILENVHDLTILAWNLEGSGNWNHDSVLARSPLDFKSSSDVRELDMGSNRCSVSSQGVHTDNTIWMDGTSHQTRYYMAVGARETSFETIAVPLEMKGPNRFERPSSAMLLDMNDAEMWERKVKSDISTGVYLFTKPSLLATQLTHIEVPLELKVDSAYPKNLWHDQRQSFFYSGAPGVKAVFLSGSFAGQVVGIVLVILDFHGVTKVFETRSCEPQILRTLRSREQDGWEWEEFENEYPGLKKVGRECLVQSGGQEFLVGATSRRKPRDWMHNVFISVEELA
ncbi:heterokaryon incompatibility protein-domain-containing protein [Hypoxylon cercidicola]|nr:heterokaryon incompatibility protein-domain-containing protein [Hypoxylon cercidicola]